MYFLNNAFSKRLQSFFKKQKLLVFFVYRGLLETIFEYVCGINLIKKLSQYVYTYASNIYCY